MRRKLKMDLHTHCGEAMDMATPSITAVGKIIDIVKSKQLDGIAITEHRSFRYGFAVKTIVEERFCDCGILIIVGREVEFGYGFHVVELRLPNGKLFKFVAHPKKPMDIVDGIRGVEIENGMNGVNATVALEMAKNHNLILLRNSDAHRLDNIGAFYNEITIDEDNGQWLIQDAAGRLVEMA